MHEDSDCRKEEEKKEKASFKLLFMGWNLPWEMNKERTKLQTEEVFTAHVSIKTKETRADALILSRLYSRHGGWARDEKWAGGEMVGEVEGMSAGAKRESGGMALRGTVWEGGWEATYDWGKSSHGWQDGGNEARQLDAIRKRWDGGDMWGSGHSEAWQNIKGTLSNLDFRRMKLFIQRNFSAINILTTRYSRYVTEA